MSKILCLANSPKESARCIAGLDLATGRLVRPVSETKSQAVPEGWATMNGRLARPLDVLDVPFASGDAVVPFQKENRYCRDGWQLDDSWKADKLRSFCEGDSKILGSSDGDAITERAMKLGRHGRSGWKSLQLIYAKNTVFRQVDGKWLAQFNSRQGRSYEMRVTDEQFTDGLSGERTQDCFLLLSLTRPWRHYCAAKSKPKKCYKLVAGVMPL